MAVTFHLRQLSASTVKALRSAPSVTSAICEGMFAFDPADYERQMLRAVPPERREAGRAGFEKRRDMLLAAREEARKGLEAAGIAPEDIGAELRLTRGWLFMGSMIGAAAGSRLFLDGEGDPLGDDVGYGPARLLSPAELPLIVSALAPLVREVAEPRFREREKKDAGSPLGDEEFEEFLWKPFCDVRAYVADAADAGRWLLKWCD